MKIEEVVHAFEKVKKMVDEAPHKEIELRKERSEVDKEEQDILHTMEFAKLTIEEMGELGFQLQKLRLRRRKIKNEQFINRRILWFLEDKGTLTDESFEELVEELKKIGNKSKNRKYKMRIRKDLQSMITN